MVRRIAFVFALVFLVGVGVGGGEAEAGSKTKKLKVCKKKKGKKSCRYVKEFDGHNAPKDSLRTEPLERPSGEISVRSENLREELTVQIYAADGGFDESVLAQLDEIFRCKRSNEMRAVDPRLYEQMSRIYDHFGKKQIVLVSVVRFKERNSSRH